MNAIKIREQIKIVKETKDFLIVYKPAGLAVQTSSVFDTDLEHILKGGGKGRDQLSVINRLDQPVEGLVLFGKNKKAAGELSKQLREGKILKEYYAVVDGAPRFNEMKLADYLVKDAKTNSSSVTDEKKCQAKKAEIEFVCLGTQDNMSLLKVRLHTGRHHQIRVQLSNEGIPIVGDNKYNSSGTKSRFPALCSYKLGFADPDSRKFMEFKVSPKGEAFNNFTELIESDETDHN